jgi:hypothetical protein
LAASRTIVPTASIATRAFDIIPSGCGKTARTMPIRISREIRKDLDLPTLYEALMTFAPDTLSIASDASRPYWFARSAAA